MPFIVSNLQITQGEGNLARAGEDQVSITEMGIHT